jgi:hypothetical protein
MTAIRPRGYIPEAWPRRRFHLPTTGNSTRVVAREPRQTRSTESLADFLYQAVFVRRSLRGWEKLRPTAREIATAIVLIAAAAFFIWVVLDVALTSHCLTNRSGPKCDGWVSK